jgi:hypothetical protein
MNQQQFNEDGELIHKYSGGMSGKAYQSKSSQHKDIDLEDSILFEYEN